MADQKIALRSSVKSNRQTPTISVALQAKVNPFQTIEDEQTFRDAPLRNSELTAL